MRFVFLLPILALAACGDAVPPNQFGDDVRENRQDSSLTAEAVPVRIGDLGPSFPACNTAGVTRNIAAGESLAVRSAPFDSAAETGRIPAGSRFFICTRSLDEKWVGIVYDSGPGLAACGVMEPVPSRRPYQGPCGSGWVSTPYVKFVANALQPQAVETPPETSGGQAEMAGEARP
jgi:hypothetical protein